MDQQVSYKWKVCVHCATYNHALYVNNTLEGFCKQETDFPFICVIVDDASSDGEQKVIKEYIETKFEVQNNADVGKKCTDDFELIYAQHKTNRNCYFAFYQLKYNHGSKKPRGPYYKMWDNCSKYVARCEGDDYWIAPLKLQKQVNILEANPRCTLVHTGFAFVNEKGEKIFPQDSIYKAIPGMKKAGYLWQDHIVIGTPILLCSTMMRQGLIDEEQPNVDYNQFMSCSRKGEIAYLGETMAAYRILSTSMMRTQHDRVVKLIKNGIFWQLYYFSRRRFLTDRFYRTDVRTRVFVSEAILSTLMIWGSITVDEKYKKLFFIMLSRPLNTLLLPVALVNKLLRRFLENRNK